MTEGVARAKHQKYIPIVLSREEVRAVIKRLDMPEKSIAQVLYHCGLRLLECRNLRMQDFNFDGGILTVHDGKGKRGCTVPLPQSILPELLPH